MPRQEYIITEPPTPEAFWRLIRAGEHARFSAAPVLDELATRRGQQKSSEIFEARITDIHSDRVRFALGYIGTELVRFASRDEKISFVLEEFSDEVSHSA